MELYSLKFAEIGKHIEKLEEEKHLLKWARRTGNEPDVVNMMFIE